MCGICGIVDYSRNSSLTDDMIRRMCTAMTHRGPDDEGIFIKKGLPSVGLGHRRLSIIDLSLAGHQPMTNEDESVRLVFNGEVYNYKELRAGLEVKGHKFFSHTDIETVIHLYEEYGEDCVKYLRGMFAFAIWDEKQDRLFFARDRIGKKPFLYYYDDRYFCFASEFSALLKSGLVDKKIDHESINKYLTFGYVPAPTTIYKKAFKLLPAHYGILENGKLTLQKYWDLDYSLKITISEKEATQELIKLLKEAIALRLGSDVPLGVFLSGGIDSSTIVALMSQFVNKVKTFSIGFEDEDYNELTYARNIAKYFSTDHHEFIVKPKALEILPLLVEHYGEPYADSSAIPTYYVARETKKYVTVALNGDGGDESFAGYERYQAMVIAERYNRIPAILRDNLAHVVIGLLPDVFDFKDKRRRLRRFLENASAPFYTRYCRWVSMIDENTKNKLYTNDFRQKLSHVSPADWLRDYPDLPKNMELVDRLMATDIKTNLANDLLVKMDIASMANSLETRSPFLDQEIMQFVARLPCKFKLKGLTKKYILKKSIKNLLPRRNIYRPKMGFGVPVGKWMRGELRDYVKDILLSKHALNRGYFNPDCLKDQVNQHINGVRDHTFGLWTLLMLELWHQEFID